MRYTTLLHAVALSFIVMGCSNSTSQDPDVGIDLNEPDDTTTDTVHDVAGPLPDESPEMSPDSNPDTLFEVSPAEVPDIPHETTVDVFPDVGECQAPEGYPVVQLDELLANPKAFHEQALAVGGIVGVGVPVCTLAECTDVDPCCNGCSTAFALGDSPDYLRLHSDTEHPFGCSGTNCDFMEHCAPLELNAGYLFWGTLDAPYGFGTLTVKGYCPNAPEIADTPPETVEVIEDVLEVQEKTGVYGKVTLVEGDCMPPAPPDCEQAGPAAGELYFIDVETGASFWTQSQEDGSYEIVLQDGEYFLWPDIGWGASAFSKLCLQNLADCTPQEYDFIQGDFEYMKDKPDCTDDDLWQSHDRCNVVIQGTWFKLDVIIYNVSS